MAGQLGVRERTTRPLPVTKPPPFPTTLVDPLPQSIIIRHQQLAACPI